MKGEGAWAFAQAFYARPGVSKRLLQLQDEHAVDIPLLLVLLDAARRGVALDGATLQILMLSARGWRRDVVERLRHARRALKDDPYDPSGELYGRIKSVELYAEEIIIRQLAEKVPLTGDDPPPVAAEANLEAYRRTLDLPSDGFASLQAAFVANPGGWH